tara:strand:- start:1059 stop:2126 length:1068 start_codon:yes stop_codon:yes gene_type:complete
LTEEETLQKLNLLGIYDPHQLEEEDLNMWWQKKYKEIKDSQLKEGNIKEKLIEINEIYEKLSKVDEKLLFEIINKKSKEENIVDSDIDLYNQGLEHYKQNEYQKSIKKFSEDVIDRGVQENLHNLIALLNKIEQMIIKLRFSLNGDEPLELDEIARKFNFSIESVRQIEAEAISKIRKLNKFINNKKNLRNEKYYSDADFFELSCYLFENEEYEISVNKISKAIKLNATEPEYFYLRGLHYMKFKNFDKALKDANNAIELNDNEPKYLELKQDSLKFLTLKKIYEYFDNCEFEKTIVQCTKEISTNNPIPEFFYYRGLAKWKSNMVHQNKSILNDFDNAITLDPDNSEILTTRGL